MNTEVGHVIVEIESFVNKLCEQKKTQESSQWTREEIN